ncbi:hypothetical protein Ahia01_000313800 [Argonauta hians]
MSPLATYGIEASVLFYLDYKRNLTTEDVYSIFENHVNTTKGIVGNSKLRIDTHYGNKFYIEDVDECLYPSLHDCPVEAWCINTNGSFMCSCKVEFEDISPKLLENPGKICSDPKLQKPLDESCPEGNCDTSWGYVALCLTILGVLVFLMVVEIMMKRREIAAEK